MESKKLFMSASTTHHPVTSAAFTAATACPAFRLGRNPKEPSRKLASNTGSMTSLAACWTTRSRTVGIPSGRFRPSGFGMYTRIGKVLAPCAPPLSGPTPVAPPPPPVGAYFFPGPPQNIGPDKTVIQGMEPAVPVPLGRQVESALELS